MICALVIVGIGFAISGEYDVTRTITIRGDAKEIYAQIADLKQWPKWTVWNTDKYPDMKTEYSGAESGVGAKSAWTGETSGDGKMEITRAVEGELVEWDLEFVGFPKSKGFATLTQVERQVVRVSYGMSGSMGSNPLMKLMSFTMDGMMGTEFDQCLTGLKKLIEETKSKKEDEQAAPID